MIDLEKDCKLIIVSDENLIFGFDCGNEELNKFFNIKAPLFNNQMLAMTCFFRHNETGKIICAFSLSPNAFKTADLPNNRRRKIQDKIPREKNMQSYPAFLIGRLGVDVAFAKQGVGSQLIRYIRSFCLNNYPYFCRFLLVDAYNKPAVLKFYENTGFKTVFSTIEQEGLAYQKDPENLKTRYMFFDMMQWKETM